MLLATFASVYPHTTLLESFNRIGVHVLGTIEKPTKNYYEQLRKRLSIETVAHDLREWDNVQAAFFQNLTHLPSPPQDALITTDNRPILEFNLLRFWRNGTQKLHPIVY